MPGRVTELATGLEMPWGLTFLPDGSALVSERHSGQISHITADGSVAAVGVVPDVERSAEGGRLQIYNKERQFLPQIVGSIHVVTKMPLCRLRIVRSSDGTMRSLSLTPR